MEFISRELSQRLAALGLASPADIRRCAGRVRRLARGLPVTDMVWLDALVQAGKLTSWQAELLDSNRGQELVVGRKFVLRSPLHRDPYLSTFEATSPGQRSRFLISFTPCSGPEADAHALQLLKSIKSLSTVGGVVPGLPVDALMERERLYLVSPFQPGDSLANLLVRRGRFPESVVRTILQDLLRQLAAVESHGVHGDLRPANVWLTHRGDVRLLNWGLLNAAVPEINIHSMLPLDFFDGLAPERVEFRKPASSSTDLYALGCLVWQLLAGRPPFIVADSLGKMTAHRQKSIPDVRTIAPDVSESMASLIRTFTNRDSNRRPHSFHDALQLASTSSRWQRHSLHQFVAQFESAAPRQIERTPQRKRSGMAQLAAMLLLGVGLTLAAWNREHLGWPGLERVSAGVAQILPTPSAPEEVTAALDSTPEAANSPSVDPPMLTLATATGATEDSPETFASTGTTPLPSSGQWLPLPAPTLDGVVQLASGLDYVASSIVTGERLTLVGSPQLPPTIHIQKHPLLLSAENVQLLNVRIVVDVDFPTSEYEAAIQLEAQTLTVRECLLDEQASRLRSMIHWKPVPDVPTLPSRLVVRNSRLCTSGSVIRMETPFGGALFENSITKKSGPLLELEQGAGAGLLSPVILKECTLRDCGPVLALPHSNSLQASGRVSIQGSDSLIDLRGGEPLLLFREAPKEIRWEDHVEIAASGLIVEVGIRLAGWRSESSGRLEEIPADDVSVDGLLSGDYHFEADSQRADFERIIIDAMPVRISDRIPGADERRIPR